MNIQNLILESNLINFVITVALIAFLFIKFIPQFTKKRREEIQKELLAAQDAKLAAEKKLEDLKQEIQAAKDESISIVKTAKINAESIKTQTIKEAKIEIDRLHTNAQREIEMHKDLAINNIKEQIAHLTMKSVEDTLITKKAELDSLIKTKLRNDLKEQLK